MWVFFCNLAVPAGFFTLSLEVSLPVWGFSATVKEIGGDWGWFGAFGWSLRVVLRGFRGLSCG